MDNLEIIHGEAPEALHDLEEPTHVFIGGSSGNMLEILSLILNKNKYAKIVATAVSLETVSEITTCMNEYDFEYTEVVAVNIAKAKKMGKYNMMLGQNPVYVFKMQNSGGNEG